MSAASGPIRKRTPEGEYSTIRYANGIVETVLFNDNNKAVATRRTYVGLNTEQVKHIESIKAELEARA